MTDTATIDWFGRWGTFVFSENTAIFFFIMQLLLEKTYLVFLLSKEICSQLSCVFCQQPQQLLRQQSLYETSAMSIHSFVKLNLPCFSVCLHNALSKWHHMTSHYVTFIDVTGTLYPIVLNQNRNGSLFGQLTCTLFIFIKQINITFLWRFTLQSSYFV